MIFTFVNSKGGVGKSTIATHFAAWLQNLGIKTLLIDTDKQGSGASWVLARKDELDEKGEPRVRSRNFDPQMTPQVMRLYDREIVTEGRNHAANYQVTVIDTKGSDSSGVRSALIISDFALVPIRDGDFDRRAIDGLVEILNDVSTVNEKLKVMSFLNQIDNRRSFPWDVHKDLEENGLAPLGTALKFRAAYSRSNTCETIFEMEKPDEKAVFELNKLFKEIMEEAKK